MPSTLAVDVGGTNLKATVLDVGGRSVCDLMTVATPKPATPVALLDALSEIARSLPRFDRAGVGFPGVVTGGVVRTAPNLHAASWADYPLATKLTERLGRPTRVLNDAGVAGYAVVKGKGVELVLTLGTGMGCALYSNGMYVPNLELAHHPFNRRKTYEEYVGLAAFKRIGKERWNARMARVLDRVQTLFYPDHVYLGGGNATQLTISLPAHVSIVDNAAGLFGAIGLWS
jgi:polyphosphate glucokinase